MKEKVIRLLVDVLNNVVHCYIEGVVDIFAFQGPHSVKGKY